MLGESQKFQEVVDLVRDWIPSKAHGHERKFQKELQDFLDERLNASNGDGLGMGRQGDDVVSREHGKSKADIAVNDAIGIEMKRDLSNSQTKTLRGQIESYLDNYNFVIVCACGIKDKDGWRELKNKYEGVQGGLGGQQEVVFVWKKKKNYGAERTAVRGGRGLLDGGGFF